MSQDTLAPYLGDAAALLGNNKERVVAEARRYRT